MNSAKNISFFLEEDA
jgi:phytanoyl-CoA hydroxylase